MANTTKNRKIHKLSKDAIRGNEFKARKCGFKKKRIGISVEAETHVFIAEIQVRREPT